MALAGVTSLLCMMIVGAIGFVSVSGNIGGSHPGQGSLIPAESRPCVDCHAFEFMQRALQDLRKTVYNLDSQTEMLLMRTEKRGLCDCLKGIR
ncbi:neuropeptide-like protein C4orf48 homolog [Bombina bombina]|uniref:neuropeptide-like protein C4orf48 homolog n=1 Tax=Bombina bombina TaxID=8345 RepID=UPI00235AC58B|nr:neuropeptide-like protein C4orf48 homolog [Bombina bombina]